MISRRENSVSIMEFCNGKVVHETQYFADPLDARRPAEGNGFSRSRDAALRLRKFA
jgi:hypothetical protein